MKYWLKNNNKEDRVRRELDYLKQKHLDLLSTKSEDFKLITGTGLMPPPSKDSRPSINDMLEQGFVQNTMASAVIRKIAEVAAKIPFKVETSSDGGETWEAEGGEVQAIIDAPDSAISGNEWRINAMTYLLSTGNTYLEKTKEGGSVLVSFSDDSSRISYKLLPTNLVEIDVYSDNTIKCYKYRPNNATLEQDLLPEQVEHIKFLDPTLHGHTSHLGLSPLETCWNILKASNNLAEADASMLENMGALGILSNKNDVTVMTEKERSEMQEATDDLLGGTENFGKTIVSGTPVEYTSIGKTSSEMQLFEGGVYKDRIICTAFGAPSGLFNDNAASTLDNLKVYERRLYTDACIPNNEVLLRPFEDDLLPMFEERTGLKYRIVQDTDGISVLQHDKNKEADKNQKNAATIISIVGSSMPIELKAKMLSEMFEMDESEVMKWLEPVVEEQPTPEEPEQPTPEEPEEQEEGTGEDQ